LGFLPDVGHEVFTSGLVRSTDSTNLYGLVCFCKRRTPWRFNSYKELRYSCLGKRLKADCFYNEKGREEQNACSDGCFIRIG
jgi:hypothetical protein